MNPTELTAFDFARLGILYTHLVACCVAIGLVVTSDFAVLRQLLKADPADKGSVANLPELQHIVALALAALWVSGLALVSLDASVKGWAYFANPKLQAKVLVVVLLTLNGVVLHQRVLPLLLKHGSLLRLDFNQSLLALFAGAVSAVSWLYAALLGVGRVLSWNYTLAELMLAYPLLIGGGFFGMLLLTMRCKYRSEWSHPVGFVDTVLFTDGFRSAMAAHPRLVRRGAAYI